eukprot:CAMPEP_0203829652 /NCGR_PEP_ID=MMETSP0115-20131106/64008_1 /ASSEMBLY_ACC=CAM_ASM_000227 /TAXON_ID=33651 /ORGANISM="Bicosoecid sp, Strain ms1" /LENGTH=114 /DNA_ID=CAMNT_0050738713 /DNA_START=23 /DNA_END=367 /DNA_ORIENTATION=-
MNQLAALRSASAQQWPREVANPASSMASGSATGPATGGSNSRSSSFACASASNHRDVVHSSWTSKYACEKTMASSNEGRASQKDCSTRAEIMHTAAAVAMLTQYRNAYPRRGRH